MTISIYILEIHFLITIRVCLVYFSVVAMFKIMTIPNSTLSQVSTIMGLSKKIPITFPRLAFCEILCLQTLQCFETWCTCGFQISHWNSLFSICMESFLQFSGKIQVIWLEEQFTLLWPILYMNTYISTNEIYMLLFLIAKTKNSRQVFDFYITLYIYLCKNALTCFS
jgi:hypothetical protein